MTEKLQLVDAGLGERECAGGLQRSRAPLEKSKRSAFVTVQNLVATGHSSNKMTAVMMMTAILFSCSSTSRHWHTLQWLRKIKWQEVHIGHVY
jgi:hypothetical protein